MTCSNATSDRVLEVVRIRLGRPLRESLESRDILQETMIDAFQGFDRYELREDAHFVNWLARIAEHRILRSAEYHGAQKRDARRAVPLEGKRGPDSEVVGIDPASARPGAATPTRQRRTARPSSPTASPPSPTATAKSSP